MLLKVSQLTKGEKLFTARRRVGRTQAQEANAVGLPLHVYKRMEKDIDTGYSLRPAGLGKLRPYEACVILRKRNGMTLDDLADAAGLTKWWLCQIEKGKAPVDTLARFWETGSTAHEAIIGG